MKYVFRNENDDELLLDTITGDICLNDAPLLLNIQTVSYLYDQLKNNTKFIIKYGTNIFEYSKYDLKDFVINSISFGHFTDTYGEGLDDYFIEKFREILGYILAKRQEIENRKIDLMIKNKN